MNSSTNFSDDSSRPAELNRESDSTIEAFRWLLILGFPASIAAARLMPEVFSDAFSDAVKVARSMTRNPFGQGV